MEQSLLIVFSLVTCQRTLEGLLDGTLKHGRGKSPASTGLHGYCRLQIIRKVEACYEELWA